MAELTADFEAGANGNTITTAAGEASATAWTQVDIAGSNTITYDSTYAAQGTLSGKLAEAGDSGVIKLRWGTGTLTEYYARLYARVASNPSSALDSFVQAARSGGTGGSWSIVLLTDGTIDLRNQAGGSVAIIDTPVTTADWFRLEWHINNTAGDYEVRLYNSAASETLTDSISGNVGAGFGADMNEILFGVGPLNHTVWLDGIVFNATDWVGPVSPQSTDVLSMQAHVFGHNMW